VEIMIVVATIGLLCAILIPNILKAGATSQANACINNLRKLDAAADQFAVEHGKNTGDFINYPSDLTPYVKFRSAGCGGPMTGIPTCPANGVYYDGVVGDKPICSLGSSVTPPHVLP